MIAETGPMKEIQGSQFDAEVIRSEVPVLVDFFTEKCSYCVQILPILEQIEAEHGAALKIVKIDAGVEQSLAAAYRIMNVPTLLLFKAGNCMGQRVGMISKKLLSSWIEDTLNGGR